MRAMDEDLSDVLSAAVKVGNFVNTQPTKLPLFTAICANMGAEYHALLMYTRLDSFLVGALRPLYELRNQVSVYLLEAHWIVRLAYLADIFDILKLNMLNILMKGTEKTMFDLTIKITAFNRTIPFGEMKIEAGENTFPLMSNATDEADLIDLMKNNLHSLKTSLDKYFTEKKHKPG